MMLAILDEHPNIFDHPTEGNLHLIRSAALRGCFVGPFPKAIELYRKLAAGSNLAEDYFQLSARPMHASRALSEPAYGCRRFHSRIVTNAAW
jgi:hypothetical protein